MNAGVDKIANLDGFQLTVANFKCFGREAQGFDRIAPFNIVIGRNNVGKSAMLDLLRFLTKNDFKIPKELWHGEKEPAIFIRAKLPESAVRQVFIENTSGGGIQGDHWQFGHQFVGTEICLQLNGNRKFIALGDCPNGQRPLNKIVRKEDFENRLANAMPNPLARREFRRIYAERNIVPENDSAKLEISGDGSGVTNIIQNFINKASLPSSVVEKELLEHLNRIFTPDATFTDIVCQQLDDGKWEIYLEEEQKGRIALSQSGSGLKTVIIVIVHLLLVPFVVQKELDKFVFGFEELENNLHPALLRRLLSYLFDYAQNAGTLFFLTTHSNVAIDIFSRTNLAQIIHVTHDGTEARCQTVKTYVDNRGLLDDLDIRASDLLQSNCILWVEGPSDRIYVTRWIELYTNGQLMEGFHYQCVFYGGRLLAHLSTASPEEVEDAIALLRVNRNCCVIMDSDKRAAQSRISDTKKRIESEINEIGGLAWITKGKEIENYLDASVIKDHLGVNVEQVGQYDDFAEYLDGLLEDAGKKFLRQKPLFAEKIVPLLTAENSFAILDLEEQIRRICNLIRKWNGIDE